MNRTAPKVSVIVPCHNAAAYLPDTLESILTQSWTDLEIVIVDDGSVDDPGAVVAGRGDPRVRLVRIPASGGPSRPRNRAISEARGTYLFFCDADDVMLPRKIDQQVRILEQGPALGLVFTDFQVIDPTGKVLVPSFLAEYDTFWRIVAAGPGSDGGLDRGLMVGGLLRANFIGTSSVAVRRSVLDDVGGFDEDLASSEDLDLWLRIARRHTCAYGAFVGHGYRRHPASLMHESAVRHPLARIEVMRRQLALDPGRGELRAIRRRMSADHCTIGYILERKGDGDGAGKHYLESLRIQPNVNAAWGWLKAQTSRRSRTDAGGAPSA